MRGRAARSKQETQRGTEGEREGGGGKEPDLQLEQINQGNGKVK